MPHEEKKALALDELFADILGQDRALEQLATGLTSRRLTHALACVGPEGVGRSLTARRLGAWLLAGGQKATVNARDWRSELRLMQDQAHPDFLVLTPDESMAKPEIKVDAARKLVGFMQQTPSRSNWRVALVEQAEKLNRQAANGILKVLEEPPAAATIILLVSDLEQVLPTIRSRVSALNFSPLPADLLQTIARQQGLDLSPETIAASAGSLSVARELSDALSQQALSQMRTLVRGHLEIAQEGELLAWCLANPDLALPLLMRSLNTKARESTHPGFADAYFAISALEQKRRAFNLDAQACWLDYFSTVKKCVKSLQSR